MDVILSHQAGFQNTVASSGTAVTAEQIKILNRLTNKFLVAFDADKAGIEATKKGVDLILNQGGDVLVIDTPEGLKDSAEVIKENPKLWRRAIKDAKPYLDYLEEKVLQEFKEPFSPQNKRDIALKVLPEIAKISDPIVAGDYLAQLSQKLNVEEKYLFEAMERINKSQITNHPVEQDLASRDKSQVETKENQSPISVESHLLGLLLVFPEHFDSIKKLLFKTDFSSSKVISIYKKLVSSYDNKRQFDLKKFMAGLSLAERDFVSVLVLDVENEYADEDKEVALDEILCLTERIKKNKKSKCCKNFEEQIKKAEKLGNKEEIKKLVREFQEKVISNKSYGRD